MIKGRGSPKRKEKKKRPIETVLRAKREAEREVIRVKERTEIRGWGGGVLPVCICV